MAWGGAVGIHNPEADALGDPAVRQERHVSRFRRLSLSVTMSNATPSFSGRRSA
jgi:hypothetical protein